MDFHKTNSSGAALEMTSDFEVVAENPQIFYAAPSDVLRDPDLTSDDKLRLLDEWVSDLEALAVADGEGMAPENDARRLRDTERLRTATNAIGILRGDDANSEPVKSAPSRAFGRVWRTVTSA